MDKAPVFGTGNGGSIPSGRTTKNIPPDAGCFFFSLALPFFFR